MVRLRTILRLFAAHPIWGAVAFASLTLVVLWAFVPNVAQALTLEGALISIVGYIVAFLVDILGEILIKFIGILVAVAQFNNFIDAPAVRIGWSVTRDISNMFFIVALLLIAVGTMFRIDQYRYSRTLQKLIMMAILINFSKAIAGFFIDFSQVVMLTFVNAFKDQAAGSLSAGFGIDSLLTISSNVSAAGGDIKALPVVGSLFAALIMVFVATVIVAIFTILLIQRIIMLWIYIVLAPTAYMVAVLPGTLGSWWSSWWRDFSQYLIKGPVIAFFLWLALTIITLSTDTLIPTTSTIEQSSDLQTETFDDPTFVSEATTGTAIINYLVAIGMLIAGLQQAAKSSGAAGAVAGKWMGNFNKWGSAIATSPLKGAKGILRRPAYGVAGGALTVAERIPLVGGMARNANARLRKSRVRMEEKDSDLVNYMSLDEKMRALKSMSNPLSMKAIGQKRNIRENILKSSDFGKLGAADRQKLHDDAQRSAGVSWYENSDKSVKPVYKDNALGRAVEDAENNDPTLLAKAYESASGAKKDYYKKRIERAAMTSTPEKISKWDTEMLNANKGFANLVYPILHDRAQASDGRFVQQMKLEALGSRAELDKGYQQWLDDTAQPANPRGPAGAIPTGTDRTLYQEDIDRKRQARTADRVAAYQQRNLNFHESDEYLKNQGQFYDQQSYATNLAQEQRRVERENLKKHGVELPVTGASSFAKGSEDTLAVSEEVLNSEGIRLGAGGTVNEEDKLKLAAALDTKLAQDIADVERDLASAAPEILDSIQEGSGTGTTVRQALQTKLRNLQGVRNRIQDTDKLGSISFINADRRGGNVRNIAAEEGFHRQLEAMDQDGSFRKELWGTMAPEEQQKIVQQMRDKTNRQDMGEEEAFEEYLAKGLTNLTRSTWADTASDAVKLDSGLALAVKRQAEAKNVKLHDLTLLQQQANVQVPSRFATVGAQTRAVARKGTEKVTGFVGATARSVSSGVSKAVSATTGAATTVGKKTADVAAAPYRAVQGALGRRSDEKARVGAMKVDQQKTAMRYTPEELQKQKKNLAGFERQTQQVSDKLMQEYQEQEQVLNTTTNRLEAKAAKEKMQRIRGDLKQTAQELKGQRQLVADYEAGLQKSQANLGGQVGESFRRGEQADTQITTGQKRFSTPEPAITRSRAETERALAEARAEAVAREATMRSTYATLEDSDAQKFMDTVAENPEKVRAQGRAEKATSRGRTTKAGKYQDVADSLQNLSQEELLQQSMRMDPTARQKILEAGKAQQAFDASTKRVADLEKQLADQKAAEVRVSTAAARTTPPPPPPPPTASTPASSAATVTPPPPTAATAPTPKSSTPPPPPAAPKAPGAPAAPSSTSQAATSTVEAPSSAPAEAEPNVTNITNVTQNITNAFKAAPSDIRGKLMGIDSKTLDSALHNSIVWKGLMSYIKNNTAEVQKTMKSDDIGRTELQKRIGKLQNHMDEGNAEAFKNEFGELQSIFSGGGGGGSEGAPEV